MNLMYQLIMNLMHSYHFLDQFFSTASMHSLLNIQSHHIQSVESITFPLHKLHNNFKNKTSLDWRLSLEH